MLFSALGVEVIFLKEFSKKKNRKTNAMLNKKMRAVI